MFVDKKAPPSPPLPKMDESFLGTFYQMSDSWRKISFLWRSLFRLFSIQQ